MLCCAGTYRSGRPRPRASVLRGHIQVGAAAPQGLGEGDPYPVYAGGLGGDAAVIAEGG